jgi:chromate reductase
VILLICGSLRAGSGNAAVLGTVATLTASKTYTGLADLPHFNPDDDRDPLDPAVASLRAAIKEADAVLICTPEYAGGLPGSFKNLLDWTVGGGEMYGKPVAWINASSIAAPTGGRDAHDSLRKVLTYAGAKIVEEACARIPVSRADVAGGQVADPDLRGRIAVAVKRLREGV